jgi:hypothetical protein
MIVVAGALDFHRNGKGQKIDQGAMAFAFAKSLIGKELSDSRVL